MPDNSPSPRGESTVSTRLAMLEQSYIYFGQEQTAMRQKLDRLYEYIFGGDKNDDSMKSQVKSISKQVEQLIRAFEQSQQEAQTIRKHSFERLEVLEDRAAALESWKNAQEGVMMDKKTLSRQYIFMVLSAIVSSTVSLIVGWLLGKLLP